MNKRFINDRGVLFELLYVRKSMDAGKSIICKRVLDKRVFSFQEDFFNTRFQAA